MKKTDANGISFERALQRFQQLVEQNPKLVAAQTDLQDRYQDALKMAELLGPEPEAGTYTIDADGYTSGEKTTIALFLRAILEEQKGNRVVVRTLWKAGQPEIQLVIRGEPKLRKE